MTIDQIPPSLRLPSLEELEQLEHESERRQLLLPLVANESREERIKRILATCRNVRLTTANRMRTKRA
jgi:hypothetical protein